MKIITVFEMSMGTSLLGQIKGVVEIFWKNEKKSKIIMQLNNPNASQYNKDITPAVQEFGYKPKYECLEMLCDFKCERNHVEVIRERYNKTIFLYVAPQIRGAA